MRFRQRHVHQTIVKTLTQALGDLGWYGTLIPQVPVNFGASPVVILPYEPQQAGETPVANTVAISIDSESPDDPFELGGLEVVEYTLFVDVYGENEPIGIAIADDVKRVLNTTHMPVLDFTSNSEGDATDEWLEFDHVVVDKLTSTALDKRTWRAVKATACCYF